MVAKICQPSDTTTALTLSARCIITIAIGTSGRPTLLFGSLAQSLFAVPSEADPARWMTPDSLRVLGPVNGYISKRRDARH